MGWIQIPASGGGGGGAVDSVNGQTGIVVLTKSNIGLANVNNTSDADKPISTATQTALDAKQDDITGNNSSVVRKDDSGVVVSDNALQFNDLGELFQQPNFDIEDGVGRTSVQISPTFSTIEDAPTTIVSALVVAPNIADTGFELGRNGTAINVVASNIVHDGTTDIGGINLLSQNFSIGNGTNPVAVRGIGYAFGFGQINDNATLDGPLQGYGFQPYMTSNSILDSYVVAFYDAAVIDTPATQGYQSISLSPQVADISTNSNMTGINLNPTVDAFSGNASFSGLSIAGQLENFGTGGANFINVNPTLPDNTAAYATGVYVSMDNVTVLPGAQSSLVFQDLTYTFSTAGDNNYYTLEYLPGGTAGSESVALVGNDIQITIETGVSNATQIKAAVDATIGINSAITVTISGVGSNAQVTAGPTNFSGGVNPGNKKAAYLDGDVEITGALSFGGALSIGKLNAFASEAVVDGGGSPTSINTLISSPTVADSTTISNADTIGLNTAMLLTVGDSCTVTSAFLGIAALALPAVVDIGSGSTVDQISGGTFAVSLQTGGAGTIDNLDLCRSLALPNGTTTINTMSGYKFDLPFGNPATTVWGFYESPGVNNYFAGNLLIGGTAGSDDTVTNGSVALEIKSTTKAFVASRMNDSERDAMTAVQGMIIFNTDSGVFEGYDGSAWNGL